jgi:copper chaperone NosL
MRLLAFTFLGVLTLSGCKDERSETLPPAQKLIASAIGHYCGMNVLEHTGPKGQILLASRSEPVWFSSARDAFSFTMLPEEPKDIRAIYVSDMAKAPSWEEPGESNWVEARTAFFVIGSRMKGGMGADETVPFSEKPAAENFAVINGGRVVTFDEVPRDYVLSAGAASDPSAPDGSHSAGTGGTRQTQ